MPICEIYVEISKHVSRQHLVKTEDTQIDPMRVLQAGSRRGIKGKHF